jgi:shikimate kinase
MNLVLIGYRGTGKSVVGKLLAHQLQMPYVGIDAQIVDRAGMPIPEIVEKHGWPTFRYLETQEIEALAGQDKWVIDTGGGVIERPENIQALQINGTLFWLKASVPTIVTRIQDGTDRPALIQGKTFTEEVAEILERRTPQYQSAAHYEIETDQFTPQQVADAIMAIWHKR